MRISKHAKKNENLWRLDQCVGDAVYKLVDDAESRFNAEQNVGRSQQRKQQRSRSDRHSAHVMTNQLQNTRHVNG